MNTIDKAHRSLERYSYRAYQEEISQSDIRKAKFVIFLYCLCLIIVTICLIIDAQAQDINSLEPDSSISTDSPDVVIIKTPTKAEAERPSTNIVVIPQTPYLDYNNFSPEFVFNLKAGQLKNATRLGLLPEARELKFFTTPRSAQEDLELYSFTIFLHQRAIKEGRDVNFYIEEVKAGRIPIARLKKDVEVCGTGFEIYPDSGLCNEFSDLMTSEQHGYHRKLHNFQLSVRNQELEAKCGYGAPTAKLCVDQGSIKDGPNGFLWKAEADPKARCKNGTTILLAKDQASITEIELLDVNQNVIFKPSYFGFLADGRPRFCAEGRPGSSFKGPLLVKYGQNCKTVSNPANRED